MSTVSKPFTFSAGATIIASEHNSNFDTIYNDYNGNITNLNISGSAAIANSKLNLSAITQNVAFSGNVKLTQNDSANSVFYTSGTSVQVLTAGTTSLYLTSGTGTSLEIKWSKLPQNNTIPTVFLSDGTYTTPSSAFGVFLTMVAGGGGGGGDGLGGNGGGGGGGGGGIYNHFYAVSPSTGYAVKVGVGGAAGVFSNPNGTDGANGTKSSFNSIIFVTGGSGGLKGQSFLGGNGGGAQISINGSGTSGGGDGFYYIKGGNGGAGIANRGGGGGGSIYGIGGQGGITGAQNSSTGIGYGAGGGGCDSDNPQSSNDASAGNAGIVIITPLTQ